jgi:hypothetical protein
MCPSKKTIPKAVRKYMAKRGRKGGKNGTGEAKRRSPAHYEKMAKIRRANRLKRLQEMTSVHLCSSCVYTYPACGASEIQFASDKWPKLKGADAEKVLLCDAYRGV